MARTYSVVGTQNVASPADTALTYLGATTVRPSLYWAVFNTDSDAIDFMVQWLLQRFSGGTADGTGTAVTPNALNDGDPAALVSCKENHTVEPTAYTAGEIPLQISVNTRAPQQWHAHDRADRIVLPAVATEGIGFQVLNAGTTAPVTVNSHHEE